MHDLTMHDLETPTQAQLEFVQDGLPNEFRFWGNVIANAPRFTKPQQDQLLRALCFGTNEERFQARQLLIESNLRLPTWVVKHNQYGLEFADALQVAVIGLIRAIDNFKYEKGCQLSTHAFRWILQALHRANEKMSTIRLPVRTFQNIFHAEKLINALSNSYERPLTTEEQIQAVGQGLKVSEDEAARLLYVYPKQLLSLDSPLTDETGDTFGDLIADPSEEPVPAKISRRETLREIKQAVVSLPPQQAAVIKLRYGLEDGIERTLDETGRIIGVTRERVRQIEANAIKKLKRILVTASRSK